MSRSYKKHPVFGVYTSKFHKKWANRRVRKQWTWDKMGNNSHYKRFYDSWSIRDSIGLHYDFHSYYQSVLEHWYNYGYTYKNGQFIYVEPTKEEIWKWWNRFYKRK